jgi:hypothetical protein
MVRFLFTFFCLAHPFLGIAQKGSLELSIFSRYDKHADYTTRYGNRYYTNDVKLWGLSHGLQFSYLHPITEKLKASVGVGHYRLGIDKIRGTSPWSNNVTARNIDYTHPIGIDPMFNTDKYHYNSISLSAGVSYEQKLSSHVSLTLGGDYMALYTYSQSYRITYYNEKYKATNGRWLGSGVNASIGVLKKMKDGRHYVNPRIIIPIYQRLSGDKVFRESASIEMTKYFSGAGISISIGRYL